jgi:hypothetical protein
VADANTDQLTVADNYYRVAVKRQFSNYWHLNLQVAYVHGKRGGYQMSTNSYIPVTADTLYRDVYFNEYGSFSKVAQGFVDGKFYTGKKIEHKVLFGPDYDSWGTTDPLVAFMVKRNLVYTCLIQIITLTRRH